MGTPIKIFDLCENVFINSTTPSALLPRESSTVFKMLKLFISIVLVLVVGALATPQAEPKAAEVPAQEPVAPAKMPVEEPVVAEKPAAAEKPVVPEKPVVAKEPVVTEKPVVVEEPVVTEKPVVAKEPVVTKKPIVVEEPVVTEKPVVAEKPATAEKPRKAETPIDRSMCSVKSATHLECLKNANFDPSELMKCGQTILSCLSDRWNVEEWW